MTAYHLGEPLAEREDRELADYLSLTLRGWWIILLAVAAAVGVAALAISQQPRVYRASSTFIVAPADSVVRSSNEAVINSVGTLDRRSIVNTFAEIASSQSVVTSAAGELGLPAADSATSVNRAVVLPDTFAIEVSVESSDPERAAALANAVVKEAGAVGAQFYPIYQARPLDEARAPQSPVRPQPARDIALAGLAGLVLGALAAFLVAYLAGSGARGTPRSGETQAARGR